MKPIIEVLSKEELATIHEQSLKILENTGVRIETALGRKILKEAGAHVDNSSKIVRFPKNLVEECLKIAPKDVTLGARRKGWDLQMNSGTSTLCFDGEGTMVFDRKTGEKRNALYNDWIEATRLGDFLDEVGMYWSIVEPSDRGESMGDFVEHTTDMFKNFSKHVQDAISHPHEAPWLKEILQVIFGNKEYIRKKHPYSFLLCPQSPLMIDEIYTDAYLSLKGWNIPVAIMPMPLMGATSPGSMISTVIQSNCEVLSMLCLLQSHEPELPFIYAPALASIEPRTGLLRDGGTEFSIMSIAVTQMARYYSLPVMASPGSSNSPIYGSQSAFERAANSIPLYLAQPDVIVGAGLYDGSMILSFEQLMMDVEIFKMGMHFCRGIVSNADKIHTDVIEKVGPGGNFLSERSTVSGMRGGEWFTSGLGFHGSHEKWEISDKKNLLEESREKINYILQTHEPEALDDHAIHELEKIHKRAIDLSS